MLQGELQRIEKDSSDMAGDHRAEIRVAVSAGSLRDSQQKVSVLGSMKLVVGVSLRK